MKWVLFSGVLLAGVVLAWRQVLPIFLEYYSGLSRPLRRGEKRGMCILALGVLVLTALALAGVMTKL